MKEQSKKIHQLFGVAVTVLFILSNGFTSGSSLSNCLANSQGSGNTINSRLSKLTFRALAIDPTNAAVVYAGTDGSGVIKSNDSGASWRNVGLDGSRITALAIDSANPNNIYAGTTWAGVCHYYDLRLFKSW